MTNEEQKIVQALSKQIEAFKKERDYAVYREADIEKQRYLDKDTRNYSESDYNESAKTYIVKKSTLVAELSKGDNLALVIENADPKIKKYLFDFVHSNDLIITEKEMVSFNAKYPFIQTGYSLPKNAPVFTIDPNYNATNVDNINNTVNQQLSELGKQHIAAQEYAKQIVIHIEKNLSNKQKALDFLGNNFGSDFGDILGNFKTAAKNKEFDMDGDSLVLHTKFMGKPQKLKFDFDANKNFTNVTFIPALSSTILAMRQQATNTNDNDNTNKNNI